MTTLPAYNAVTASAKILPAQRKFSPKYQGWQDELWGYYDTLGEFESGIDWKANTVSRIRLTAAEISPAGDEPTVLDSGPAVEAVERLAGGTGGQTQLMKEMTRHLSVPGECWLLGEVGMEDSSTSVTGEESWSVRSADELRVATKRVDGRGYYEVREGDSNTAWRPVSADSLVVRVWDPHPRYGWQANSAARHARTALIKLDLINKRIIATIISRLASNGLLVYDKERLSIPTTEQQPEGGDEVDPFAALLVDVASRGIRDPMSPEAVIPIPLGYSIAGDLANVRAETLIRHVTFSSEVDAQLLEQRQDALRELATSLDEPVEALLGVGDLNHWGAWQVEESGIKIHIAPTAELICHSLTKGYLTPYLKAAGAELRGPSGGKIIIWYDTSELTVRPDKTQSAREAYDRLEINGQALRRETGFNEDDAPDKVELRDMILKKQTEMPQLSAAALLELTGTRFTGAAVTGAPPDEAAEEPTEGDESTEGGPPDNLDDGQPDRTPSGPPPASLDPQKLSNEDLAELYVRVQAAAAERFVPNGRGGWQHAGATLDDRLRVTPKRRDRGSPVPEPTEPVAT